MKKINFKKDFPIFKNNKNLVYLDSAATSQKPQIVIDAINNYYKNYNSNIHRGLYPIAEKATYEVEKVREKVAKFINAKDKSEIIFVRNTTEAINLVANSWGKKNIQKKDTIATTIIEHHSNFIPWQQLAKNVGCKFKVIDIDDNYNLKFNKLNLKNLKFLAISHASNVLGTMNPVKEIIKEVKKSGNKEIKVLVDGAQSVPHLKIDVQDLDCDFFAFSGHKMMAATGIGILYVKKEILEQMDPFLFGGGMIKEVTIEKTTFSDLHSKFEAGTPDIAGIISLGAAIEYLKSANMENIQKYEKNLTKYFLSELSKLGNINIYGSKSLSNRLGVVAFNIEGIHAHDVSQILGDMNICVRAGHHCAMPLHNRLNLSATVRVSFYIYNDFNEIDKLIKGIRKVKKLLKLK